MGARKQIMLRMEKSRPFINKMVMDSSWIQDGGIRRFCHCKIILRTRWCWLVDFTIVNRLAMLRCCWLVDRFYHCKIILGTRWCWLVGFTVVNRFAMLRWCWLVDTGYDVTYRNVYIRVSLAPILQTSPVLSVMNIPLRQCTDVAFPFC